MSEYVGQADGVKTSSEGHHKFESQAFTAGIPLNFNPNSLKVVQRAAGANMSVDVSVGSALLITPDGLQSYNAWTDAAKNVAVATADATNPRIDRVVAWIDPSSFSTGSNNSPGSFKFSVIAGTPSGTPSAVNDAAVQTALGSNIAWIPLATLLVNNGTINITNSVIADVRTAITSTIGMGQNRVSNPYKFNAYRAAALSSPSGAQATVVFDTKRFDTSSNYSTSTGKFTAPIAGFYMFTSTVLLNAASTRIFISWVKNGSIYRRSTDNISTAYCVSDSLFIQLAANDTIEVQLYTGSSQAVDNIGQTEFAGFLVSVN